MVDFLCRVLFLPQPEDEPADSAITRGT